MRFRPVFYIINGWSTIEKTKEMVDNYVAHGVCALQFDMPSADPSRESEFIQERMRSARNMKCIWMRSAKYVKNIQTWKSTWCSIRM